LEWIHSKNIVYKDVKPENFLIGIKDPNVIYVVDFGLCKKYRSSKTGKHLLPKYTGKFTGTVVYASTNALIGKETSRRDDLISLGYMLIVLLKRNIPLNISFKNFNKEKFIDMMNMKKTGERLYKGIPKEIGEFVKYSKNLKFEQDPDYSYLRSLFTKVLMSFTFNYRRLTFSWIESKDGKLLGIPKNSSFRKSSPQYRIFQNIKERKENQLSVKSMKLNNISNETYDNQNIFGKILNINNFNTERTDKSIYIKNYINNTKLYKINSEKRVEPNHIKQIPLHLKKKINKNVLSLNNINNNINNLSPTFINRPMNIISRNKENIGKRIRKNNNQQSCININFYTNNTIFQKDDQESEIKFNNSNNSNTNNYYLNKSNNSKLHHINSISNLELINYVKNIKNKNDNITNTIFTREKRNHNNSKIILNKRDKILNLRNIIQKKKVNSYIPFDNKNSFINYNNKNADKFISNKLIKSPKQLVQRTYQNSIIPDRNNNKILNNYHTNSIQSFNKKNNFIHLNNNIYRSPLSKVYIPKINLKKHINTAEKKAIYKDISKSDIDLFRNKINTEMIINNKNQNLNSLQNDVKANYLNNNYIKKDNYLPMRKYSKIRMSNSYSINLLNNKSMRNNYNFNSSDNNNFFNSFI
jgi:serine/threonine protein kinase